MAARRGEGGPARLLAAMVPPQGPALGGSGLFPGRTPLRSSTQPRPPGAVARLAQGVVVAAPVAGRTPRRG
eukprot:2475873-Alexandrium_andersonii.AAC.1